jgi:hypothetical protein
MPCAAYDESSQDSTSEGDDVVGPMGGGAKPDTQTVETSSADFVTAKSGA